MHPHFGGRWAPLGESPEGRSAPPQSPRGPASGTSDVLPVLLVFPATPGEAGAAPGPAAVSAEQRPGARCIEDATRTVGVNLLGYGPLQVRAEMLRGWIRLGLLNGNGCHLRGGRNPSGAAEQQGWAPQASALIFGNAGERRCDKRDRVDVAQGSRSAPDPPAQSSHSVDGASVSDYVRDPRSSHSNRLWAWDTRCERVKVTWRRRQGKEEDARGEAAPGKAALVHLGNAGRLCLGTALGVAVHCLQSPEALSPARCQASVAPGGPTRCGCAPQHSAPCPSCPE